MSRRVFDGTPAPAVLLAAVGVIVVAGAIAWLVSDDGGSERGFTAAGEAGAPASPDATEPLENGDANRRPASDRPKDERANGSTSTKRSRGRSEKARGRDRPADTARPGRRDNAKPAPDLQRLLEDAIDGHDEDQPRARPPAKLRKLLEGTGGGDQEASGGLPPEFQDALEEIARGG